MLDLIMDAFIDSIKLLPFLFLTYLAMEYLEHKTTDKTKHMIKNSGKAGPFIGAVLGAFPQCGFSAAASNLYAGRVITLGTLIAIYLSTSDEMLPVLLSEKVPITVILKFIAIKIIIGMIAGFVIDFIFRKNKGDEEMSKKIGYMCDHAHCRCDKSILKSSLKHTMIIFAYILVITIILNSLIYWIGEEALANLMQNKFILGPVIAAFVGLIPNCASSVVITQLYVEGLLSVGTVLAGLLAGAGVGVLVLFKENRKVRENIQIVGILYVIGVVSGIVIDLLLGLLK